MPGLITALSGSDQWREFYNCCALGSQSGCGLYDGVDESAGMRQVSVQRSSGPALVSVALGRQHSEGNELERES